MLNRVTDLTNRVEIMILCKRVESSHAIDKLRQPGLKMIVITLGFLDNFSKHFLFGCCVCPYDI